MRLTSQRGSRERASEMIAIITRAQETMRLSAKVGDTITECEGVKAKLHRNGSHVGCINIHAREADRGGATLSRLGLEVSWSKLYML